jgi:hypothetical protein
MLAPTLPLETDAAAPSGNGAELTDDYIYLTGRPTLRQFLNFVRNRSAQGHRADVGALTDEWRAAAACLTKLEKSEAGWADHPVIEDLPSSLDAQRDEFLRQPLVQHGFNTLPTQLGMVELDRLVVYQHHIDLGHCERLKQRLGLSPDAAAIFRLCLPADPTPPPARWARAHRDTYVFASPSNDLRFLGVMPLESENVTGCTSPGTLAGVVGLAVGFGSNFLSLISAYDRLILHNGSHRAYTLRSMGITHAPCIIQHVYSREELNLVASSAVTNRPELFVRQPRPPLLKDYFDSSLHQIIPVVRRLRQVTVKFQIEESYVPAV